MAAPPLKEDISAPYPAPSNATARAGFGKLWDYVTGLLGPTGDAIDARAALGFKRGADIASASTINLTTATGDIVDVTGTTAVTAITLADGEQRTVRFTGALVLTHGASLALPGGANITTAAGDFAVFRGYAGSVVRCVAYTKASGLPVVVPASISAASQADQEAATSTTTFVSPGRQHYHPGMAKAWCYHTGATPTIGASYNVSSITKLAGGDYQYNWTVGFSTVNYVVSGVGSDAGGTGIAVGHQYSSNASGTAALRWRNVANALIDPAFGNVIVLGDFA